MTPRTYYDTLQVSRFASPSVIRAAYKALSQRHHPDKNPSNLDAAHQNMKRLNEAYEVLSDPSRKAAYDAYVATLERPQPAPPPAPRPPPPPEPSPRDDWQREGGDRDFHGQRRYDSDSNAGQRGYFAGKKAGRIWSRIPVESTVVLLFFIGLFAVLYTRESDQGKSVPPKVTSSKYPRCVGSSEVASCESLEAAMAKDTVVSTRERAEKLDAERARNMQLANAKGKPAPVVAAALPLSPSKIVAPVVVRKRDYSCLSTVTLNLNSTNYSGIINVELRSGMRPGSTVVEQSEVFTTGVVRVANVCPGSYFFAFSTLDSPSVSTTRYFDVRQDSTGYSMPEITVTFSQSLGPESQRVGTAAKSAL